VVKALSLIEKKKKKKKMMKKLRLKEKKKVLQLGLMSPCVEKMVIQTPHGRATRGP